MTTQTWPDHTITRINGAVLNDFANNRSVPLGAAPNDYLQNRSVPHR